MDSALNVVLVCSLLIAVGGIGYALSTPDSGESFTEFYLLDEDRRLVATEYSQNFTRGEGEPLYVGIGNHQGEPVNYTVVVEIQRVDIADDSLTVREERELDRFTTTVTHNETQIHRRTLAPRLVGDRLQLAFLLYRGPPPADPSFDNAYRELHLWVNVSDDSDLERSK